MGSLDPLYSSKKHDWETPQVLFDALDYKYQFTLDVAANENNTKCSKFFSEEDNGLEQMWVGETTWCNPPYKNIDKWVAKNYLESIKDNKKKIMLIPARTDTKYWHDYVMRAQEIYFIKGRLKFSNSKNSAPFPSAIIVFDRREEGRRLVFGCDREFKQLW